MNFKWPFGGAAVAAPVGSSSRVALMPLVPMFGFMVLALYGVVVLTQINQFQARYSEYQQNFKISEQTAKLEALRDLRPFFYILFQDRERNWPCLGPSADARPSSSQPLVTQVPMAWKVSQEIPQAVTRPCLDHQGLISAALGSQPGLELTKAVPLLMEFQLLDNLWPSNGMVLGLALLQPETISLLLALFGGALGSTVYLFQRYVRQLIDKTLPDGQMPLLWYWTRPLMGIVVGLAFYFVVMGLKALFGSNGGAQAGLATVNLGSVAVVGLIGFTGGLMSWQVLDWIQGMLGRLLRNWSQDSLWAHGLLGVLKTDSGQYDDQLVTDLAGQLGVSPEQLRSWAEERGQVPRDAQQIIAAYLRRPRRELFTSLPRA